MIERTAVLGSPVGLHARPAKVFSRAVAKAGFPVSITKGGSSANAASILGVLSLGIGCGEEVTLSTEDDLRLEELTRLAELLTTNLDEA